jgi:Fe2+ transport system protein B
MKITNEFLKNISKIMKITGFIISAQGDSSVGINPTTWKLEEDFYFDDQEELEEFRNQLKELFTNYCGEISFIETYEEYQKQIDAEDLEYFAEFPVRYLIRDRGYGADIFKQANFCASYSSEVGTAIHTELPKWIPEKGDAEYEVIKSTDSMYKEILLKAAERLENEIRDEEYRLKNAKLNLRIINKELNIGLKIKK